MSESFSFVVEASDGEARACAYSTPHGIIRTPCFMPVGTQASVKGVFPQTLADSGASVVLANTYHLLLRPRLPVLEKVGGVRAFMRWQGALLTDSGGFQALSLGELVKVEEGGIVFRSHIDGTRLNLTPELAMQAQRVFDSTIAMALDECVPSTSPVPRLREAVERSALWGERSLAYWRNEASQPSPSQPSHGERALNKRALFGIVQGGLDLSLRRLSAERTLALGFDGYALGGFAVGENPQERNAVLAQVAPWLPQEQPRYLMGVGKPRDLIEAVACGIDLFDCVLPTRSGRTGQAFCFLDNSIHLSTRNLRNARYKEDTQPLEQTCPCPCCAQGFSRAYLHHLVKAGEMLAPMLLSAHNLFFYQRLMTQARDAVKEQRFANFLATIREEHDD